MTIVFTGHLPRDLSDLAVRNKNEAGALCPSLIFKGMKTNRQKTQTKTNRFEEIF
jgi:hypothetical protein